MKTIDTDDAAPQFALGAAIDAQEQHRMYWPTHTAVKQRIATNLKALAHDAYGYTGSKVYMTAREKFITVKIDKPKISTTWQRAAELQAMHQFVVTHNIEPVASKKNLVFRVPK